MNEKLVSSSSLQGCPDWLNRKSASPNVDLTRVAALLPFVGFLDAIGAPIPRLLSKARIPFSALQSPAAPLPVPFAHRFIEHAVRSQGISAFGMQVGARTTLEDFGAYGHLLRQSATIYDYFRKGIRHAAEINTGARFYLDANGIKAKFSYRASGGSTLARVEDDLFVLRITINTLREQAGGRWSPRELCIPGLSPEGVKAIRSDEALANTHILTTGVHAYLTFPVAMLSMPFRAGSGINGMPSAEVPLAIDLHGSLRQAIEAVIAHGYPEIDLVAEAAGMRRRTLQRRLAESGTSYSVILEDTRIDLASRWLRSSEMSIGRIADSLGYSDPSNFTRAFRKRTGVSPKSYRRRALCSDECE